MTIQTIFTMSSPYRDDFRIKAYCFGQGEKSLAIVGAMRGDEMQQQYVAAQLVRLLQQAEKEGKLAENVSISIIPSANPFSMNIEKRFWALDNTDINRMFPGYNLGETTQRIAAALFEYIQDFKYGVQLASYYLPGNFVPHVRLIDTGTGFTDISLGKSFGFPYVTHRKPDPFDTVLLNYNWQIWNTQAFSLYAGTTETIDPTSAQQAIDGVLRFMVEQKILSDVILPEGLDSEIIDEEQFLTIQAPHAGILTNVLDAGTMVEEGMILACIMHPYEGYVVSEVKAPCSSMIFFARNKSITYQNTVLFRL
ncbi:MAG: M14 family metallopeptidase, partial [Bacteroidales bacterium]|nr:M14 family metallopeptidase [Bacteroidales bacterium]